MIFMARFGNAMLGLALHCVAMHGESWRCSANTGARLDNAHQFMTEMMIFTVRLCVSRQVLALRGMVWSG